MKDSRRNTPGCGRLARKPPEMDATTDTPASSTTAPKRTAVVIRPRTGWSALDLGELWRYRELLYFLTWRDVLVRYKQAVLGVAWAVLQPLLTMVVFTVVFGRLLGVQVPATRRALRRLQLRRPAAVAALRRARCTRSGAASSATPTCSPRSTSRGWSSRSRRVLGGLVDFVIAFVVLLGLMAVYGVAADLARWCWLPLFVLLAVVTALGVSASGSSRSTCSTATCSTSSRSWCSSGCSSVPVIYPVDSVPEASWARRLRAQPDDRRDRGLPLGAPRRASPPELR